ncbi:Putative phage integrase family protein [Magnetospirillum gryphiswaldense MSR-1 v2]|uniref:Phage integrase family protein n=1 Tax=Magnetospirillum gryphiswaldense (strain DSM 6361 / JCM 21280 / NBRC 15271 / MSR-1) TaxID=431944 RepID=V6F6Y6_MAGGM|nr:DUF6538 domain-containing protein [Magnetospirillum gryphiswaldense]CDL00248.1 Putative phage integrase family protein [Magnetospirillum gryphiswaldense MSR-1 v2]
MSVAQHTIRRGGTYHLRCRVPFDLVAVLGRSEIHRSLGTACPKEGKRRAIRLYGLFVDIFDGVRVMAETKEEWLAQLAAMDAKSRADRIGELFDLATLCVKEAEQERALREKRDGQIREMGEHLGYFIGQLADSVSPERLALLEHWKATFSALTRDRDDLKRQRDELADSATVAQGAELISAITRRLGLPLVSATTPTVSQFLNDTYAKERRLADDSHRHITNFISLFAKITGDKRLADYTRTDVVDYVRTLERLSRSTGKSPEDKTASVKRLLEKSVGKPTMNATTIGKHVQHVKGFFNTARKHLNFTTSDTIDQMFDGIDLSDFVPSIQKRKIWSIDKLNALFNTPIWQGTFRPRQIDRPGSSTCQGGHVTVGP